MPRKSSKAALSSMATMAFMFLLAAAAPGYADWQAGLDAFKAGKLGEAEQHFRQVADDKPDWYGGHRMLGQVLLRLERPKDALAPLTKAHELAPTDAATRFDLGRASLGAEKAADALKTLGGPRPSPIPDALWRQWLHYRAEAARQSRKARPDPC